MVVLGVCGKAVVYDVPGAVDVYSGTLNDGAGAGFAGPASTICGFSSATALGFSSATAFLATGASSFNNYRYSDGNDYSDKGFDAVDQGRF